MVALNFFAIVSFVIAASSGIAVSKGDPSKASDVCYGDLGCFTTADPWTSNVRPISALPEDPAVINTRFLLNTRANPTDTITLVRDDTLGLNASPFDSTKKIVFLIHGWTNDANHPWMTSSVSEILINEDVNIIRVDWAPGAGLPYLRALTNTQVVGAEISLFILFLAAQRIVDYSNIHLIGHDLGAHVASYAGRRIYGIGRITGLDPSTIYFEGGDTATRLDPTDALLVDIVHTDATFPALGRNHVGLGFKSSLGHVDIFVNNGQEQPGCQDTLDNLVKTPDDLVTLTDLDGASSIDQYVCSHMRAVDYFVESINSFCPFSAFPCSSWDSYLQEACYSTCRNSDACTSLGYHTGDYPARGSFYLDTQALGPYCNLVLRLEVDISPSQLDTGGSINYILIGDVGQTKETELYKGNIATGMIVSDFLTVAGSNSYRIGHVQSVRLRYDRTDLFGGQDELLVQRVVVQQANVTITAADNVFQGAVLPDTVYVTVYP